jgi:hypothetical protein
MHFGVSADGPSKGKSPMATGQKGELANVNGWISISTTHLTVPIAFYYSLKGVTKQQPSWQPFRRPPVDTDEPSRSSICISLAITSVGKI